MAFSTLRCLLVVAIAMAGLGLNAYQNQFTVDGLTYVSNDGATVAVYTTADTMTVVNIPETVEHDGVVYDVTGLLYVGSGVRYLRVPASVVDFELSDHPNLHTLSIGTPNIPEDVFSNCYQLKNIIFEETVRTIGFRAFECSVNLMTLTFMSSDTEHFGALWNANDMPHRLGYIEDTPRLIKVRVPQGAVSKFKGRISGYIVEQSETDSYADFIAGGIAYRVTADGEAYVTGCTADTRDLVIPATVTSPQGNTYSVVGIDKFAVSFHEHLRTVSIPESVVSIDKQAFVRNCDIEGITVAQSNPMYSSQGCNVLLNTAEGELLYACKNAVIPQGTLRIGNRAFADCPVMTQPIVIPASVKAIGDSAFYKNTSLGSDLQLAGDLESIGAMAFARCPGIESVTIGTHVNSIGSRALRYCDNLTQMYYNAKNCSVSTGYVLNDWEVIDDLHWLTTTEYMTTGNCSALSEVVVGDGVEVLPEEIFLEQVNLKKVDLPASLQEIGTGAFDGCERLDTLICRAIVPPAWEESNVYGTLNVNKAVLKVPFNSWVRYNTWPWTWFNIEALDAAHKPDVTGDGMVDIADVNTVINAMIGKINNKACDFNGDGNVDISDVNAIINAMLNIVPPEPPVTDDYITFTVNGISFKMVAVEGGSFPMGYLDDGGASTPEQVTVNSFYIGQTEVTSDLWVAVTQSSSFSGGELPVDEVDWWKIQSFLYQLNQLTGKQFRLPTEAEWEFAARGGNKSQGYRYAGSNQIGDVAWWAYNSDRPYVSWDNCGAHDVATKAPNELGLYDMSGNVWEMCEDLYDNDNPNSNDHVMRGGCWQSYADQCTVTARYYAPLWDGTGFRLALTAP